MKLYDANRKVFAERFPEILRMLDALAPPPWTPVVEDGTTIDFILGGKPFYGGSAEERARAQLDEYFESPGRVVLNEPAGVDEYSPDTIKMMGTMAESLNSRGVVRLSAESHDEAMFLLVLGVGLGPHLAELVERTRTRQVLLVEPVPELLAESLNAADWNRIVATCDASGASLDLIAERSPEIALRKILKGIDRERLPHPVGSYVYTHFETPETVAIRDSFLEEIKTLAPLHGFFEDEVRMVVHTARNFLRNRLLVIDGRAQRRREPVFVVGSGPSVDACFEVIAKNRDRAVVVSLSTALQALLHHGVEPDFQIEMENDPETTNRFRHVHALHEDRFPDGRFGDAMLLASTSVDPGAAAFFADAMVFFRPRLTSTAAFGAGRHVVKYAEPLVLNAALAALEALGFGTFYLFGCDMGTRAGGRQHTEHSIYFTHERFRQWERLDMPATMPANFGGTARTNDMYILSAMVAATTIKEHGLDVTNCSDGVALEGARPQHHGGVALTGPALDREALRADMRSATREFAARSFFRNRPDLGHAREWAMFIDDFAEIMKTSRREDEAFADFFGRVFPFLFRSRENYGGVPSMVFGTAWKLAQIGMYYTSHVEDAAKRKAVLSDFLAAFEKSVLDLSGRGHAVFADVARDETVRDSSQAP